MNTLEIPVCCETSLESDSPPEKSEINECLPERLVDVLQQLNEFFDVMDRELSLEATPTAS